MRQEKSNQDNRKLAAIVFTDIAGFTELTSKNEDDALELVEYQRNVLKPIVEKYQGVWLKEMGDGLLLIFGTAISAVSCCIEIQKISKRVEGLNLRISIHVGEILETENDVYGDDVNIASRIEKYSPIGGIAISESVQPSLQRTPEYETIFIGNPKLKGVSRDIKVFAITSHNLPKPASKYIEDNLIQSEVLSQVSIDEAQNSIAILPFLNISGKDEDEFFADGMTDAIITNLSKINGLRVISRTSAMHYKNTEKKVPEIAHELNVNYLVEGSIIIYMDEVQISVNLLDAKMDKQIWSNTYKRDLQNVLSILKDVSMAIIDGIESNLTPQDKLRLEQTDANKTIKPEAYKLYLMGRQSRQRKDLESMNRAQVYLQKSIELDPRHAPTYAEIALNKILMGAFGFITINNELREIIFENAERSLHLNANTSEAYTALALAWEFIDHDQKQAEKLVRHAVILNPGNSEAIQEHAFILGRMDEFESAIQKMQMTISLDPLSIPAQNGLAYIYFYQGNYQSTIKQMRGLLELDPSHYLARFIISLSLTALHDYSSALRELDSLSQTYTNINTVAHRGYILARMGEKKDADEFIAKIKQNYGNDPLLEFSVALIYAGMDKKDSSFSWLNSSQEKYGFVYRDKTIGEDIRMRELKEDPRFDNLIYT